MCVPGGGQTGDVRGGNFSECEFLFCLASGQ